jgi:hypothetical protein
VPRDVAIAIGVKRSAGLTPLDGAPLGAEEFAQWADASGFDVVKLVDAGNAEVTRGAIYRAVREAVLAGDVARLLVFFAGHGIAKHYDQDIWLLTGSGEDPGEAVDVARSVALARTCGIPHVAMFADACRTIASQRLLGVDGSTIFPDEDTGPNPVTLDLFYASQPTNPALEVVVPDDRTERAFGVFSRQLMRALNGEDRSAAHRNRDTGAVEVTAQSLAGYLWQTVPNETSILPGAVTQYPDCRPASYPPKIIATVAAPDVADLTVEVAFEGPPPDRETNVDILRWSDQHLAFRYIADTRPAPASINLPTSFFYQIDATQGEYVQRPVVEKTTFAFVQDCTERVVLARRVPGRPPIEPGAPPTIGLTVAPSLVEVSLVDEQGRRHEVAPHEGVFQTTSTDLMTGRTEVEVQHVRAGQRPDLAERLTRDDVTEEFVERLASNEGRDHFESEVGLTIVGVPIKAAVVTGQPAADLFFEGGNWHIRGEPDRSSSVVIDLRDDRYLATALLEGFIGTVSVFSAGAEQTSYLPARGGRFDDPGVDPADARRALAMATAAARLGRFDVAVDRARQVAGILRRYKHYNPVLGIFAAYAYQQAGDIGQINDMIRYFVEKNQVVPYDVAMLAQRPPDSSPILVAPAFPMLAQGWAHLGPDSELHPALAAARRSLGPALWATPTGRGGAALTSAVAKGEL